MCILRHQGLVLLIKKKLVVFLESILMMCHCTSHVYIVRVEKNLTTEVL